VSVGGLAVAIAESAIGGGVGVEAIVEDLFAEGEGRAVLSARPGDVPALRRLAGPLPLEQIGETGGDAIRLTGDARVTLSLTEARRLYESAIPLAVDGGAGA
jgi:phosphoribosylformylglycinamidine (FGAM) synthase-like enzyme